jgi:Membrane-associated apoptosis protein
MAALLLSQMRQAITQNQSTFEKMRGADEGTIKELGKRIGIIVELILDLTGITCLATSLGVVLSFRDLLFNGMTDIFAQKFPDVLGFVDQLSCSGIGEPENFRVINILANQLGRFTNSDLVLKLAASTVATTGKDCALSWQLLPLVYASMVWQSCYDPKTKYEMKFDGILIFTHRIG